jgi:type IV pilus assembly protein PilN
MRITLNLATHPFVDVEPRIKLLRVTLGSLVLIAAGLGLCLIAIHQKAEQARACDRLLDSQIAHINQERQGYKIMMQRPENAELLNRIGELNQILDEKVFSWTLAMEDLETVLPGGVQVTTLEPYREKDGNTTLHLRVIGPRDRSLDLVRNLERSRHFLIPRIVGESFETSGGPNEKLEPVSSSNRVNFDLLAEYNAAALTEPIRLKENLEQKPEKADDPAAETKSSQLQSHVNNILAFAAHPPAISPTPNSSVNVYPKETALRPNSGGQR